MAEVDERDESTSRGNEWEVVSLTASAYAAAPGPNEIDSSRDTGGNLARETDAEISRAMFMSGHFVFPPSQHENLPLEPEHSKTHDEKGAVDGVSPFVDEDKLFMEDETYWNMKGLMSHKFPGIQIFDEKGTGISTSGVDLGKDVILDKENTSSTTGFPLLHFKSVTEKPYVIKGNEEIHDKVVPQDHGSDSGFQKSVEAGKYDEANLPCEAWWKRRALSLYVHAKEADTFWSIFIAAAVMGLVIIGHKWQQERWKVLHLKWQLGVSDEIMGRILSPIYRFKDVIVGGHRRGSLVRGSASKE